MIGFTENGYIGFLEESNQTDIFRLIQDKQNNIKDMKLIKTFPFGAKFLIGKEDNLCCDKTLYKVDPLTDELNPIFTFRHHD